MKIVLKIGSLIGIIALLGCYGVPDQRGVRSSTLEKIKRQRTIDVCYVVYPPTVIKDPHSQQLSGHLIDTLRAILDPIKVTPIYHEQGWGTAVQGLRSYVCDLMVSGYFINITRAYSVAFTRPLFYIGDGALVKKGDTRFPTIQAADTPEITVAVATGESGHEYVKHHFNRARVRAIDIEGGDLSRLFLEISSGRADIAIADAWSITRYAQVHPETEALFVHNSFNMNPVAWAVRQEDLTLLRFIENALETLSANGKLREFERAYDAHWLHKVYTYQLS